MGLMTVYFPGPSNLGFDYRKAIIYEEDIEFFIGMGAQRVQDYLDKNPVEVEAPSVTPVDPDKGWGKPGTFEFAKTQILNCVSSKEIHAIVYEITKTRITSVLPLLDARDEAIKLLKEHYKND